jgi:hypothetical protein
MWRGDTASLEQARCVEDADQYWEEGAQEVVSYLHEDVGVSAANSRGRPLHTAESV